VSAAVLLIAVLLFYRRLGGALWVLLAIAALVYATVIVIMRARR
jgi:hypothetical protein